MSSLKIGVVIGSTRPTRISPRLTQYIVQTIKSQKWQKEFDLSLLDLKTWNLPLLDEPMVPALVKLSSDYQHEHTRKWSAEIQTCDGFIFIAPQYNWGYPACLKNAIDYLFNEWTNKPAMIVSYGSHGGLKCYEQFKQVLEGLHMKVIEAGVFVSYPTKKEIMGSVSDDFNYDQLPDVKVQILKAFEELLMLL